MPNTDESRTVYAFGRYFKVYRSGEVLVKRRDGTWQSPKIFQCKSGNIGKSVQVYANKDRYNKVSISRPAHIAVALLLGIAYLSDGEDLGEKGWCVYHLNGDKNDDRLENLKWASREDTYKKVIRKDIPVGTKCGWLTVDKCIGVERKSKRTGKPISITHSVCHCRCGNEVTVITTELYLNNRCFACDDCKFKYGYTAIKHSNCYTPHPVRTKQR